MSSSIQIDFQTETRIQNNPAISVELVNDESDAGLLLRKFFQSLEGESGEVTLKFKKQVIGKSTWIVLFQPDTDLGLKEGVMKDLPYVPEVGDFVGGWWRDTSTGKTYYVEGVVEEKPAGLFVVEKSGATPLTDFISITKILK